MFNEIVKVSVAAAQADVAADEPVIEQAIVAGIAVGILDNKAVSPASGLDVPHAADLCGLKRVELIDRCGFFAAGELVKLAVSVLHGDISDLLRIERENLLFGAGKGIVHFRGLNLRQNEQNHGVCENYRRNDDENSPQLPAFHVGSTS